MSNTLNNQVRTDLAGLKSFVLPPPHSSSPEAGPMPVHHAHIDPTYIAAGIAHGNNPMPQGGPRLTFSAKRIDPPSKARAPSPLRLVSNGPPSTMRYPESPHKVGTLQAQESAGSSPSAPTTTHKSTKNTRSVSPMTTGTATNRSSSRNTSGTTTPHSAKKVPSLLASSVSAAQTARVIKRNPSELEVAKSEADFLRQSLNTAEDRAQEDSALIRSLEEERTELEAQVVHAQRQISAAEVDYREKQAELLKEVLAKETALRELAQKDNVIAMLNKKLANAMEETEVAVQNANARITTITEAANTRMSEFEVYITKLATREKQLCADVAARDERIKSLETALEAKHTEFKTVLLKGELQRSDLHNRIQEMKGNIRVYARVRPLIPHDREYRKARGIECYAFPDKVDHRTLTINMPGAKDYAFEFDKVFEPTDSQDRVFDEISQLVQSALDGYKVCIFVYGQTGSGKTFTMEGNSEHSGMIQRAVERIFIHSQEKRRSGWTYTLRASFVEIYNEAFHDLLNPAEFRKPGPGTIPVKHDIRTTEEETFITNVEEVNVEDASTVHRLLEISRGNRKCESTLMNDRASRSHSVFTLKIHGVNEGTAQVLQGVLNLVDLAGSERISKSGVEGDRLRETQSINKSLSSLGDVIVALAKGDASHVPFRNSKLTHMLQPYMGGESKTLMFVNISPAESHLNESLCSLRFAAKVNSCEIGLASRKVSSVPGGAMKR